MTGPPWAGVKQGRDEKTSHFLTSNVNTSKTVRDTSKVTIASGIHHVTTYPTWRRGSRIPRCLFRRSCLRRRALTRKSSRMPEPSRRAPGLGTSRGVPHVRSTRTGSCHSAPHQSTRSWSEVSETNYYFIVYVYHLLVEFFYSFLVSSFTVYCGCVLCIRVSVCVYACLCMGFCLIQIKIDWLKVRKLMRRSFNS